MTSPNERPAASRNRADHDSGNLFGRTLRSVVLLVGACVLFVGALSVAAVAITSKAVGSSLPTATDVDSTSTAAKKPRSI